jgi:hypothetical protein
MDGTLTLEQYIIFIKIASFSRPFKNVGLKLTLPLASPTLLGTAILILLHLYCGVIMCLNFVIYSIFQTSLLTLYPALPAKEMG